ncbi:MAG: Protein serine/threonine phosphatase PrpC, regulation of stationary phase [uncultured Chloroflexi bacterium]|uniref:Protein serine/threonine phosphatase PrpC, regulation of stationary phase n=1 Tax=uncultured Chloroflexota bacterium TaxID=166587 RepID=A0A6J4HKE0_9CHLR|nr:MAG: Protein serine/threonine phosphatase PrpC, regulation of stationary phase [uncultured Chloroflexota bacterium]
MLDTTGAPSGPRLRSAAATHPGLIRQNNEDTLAAHVPAEPALLENKGVLFAIADGVGGQAAGEVASRTATKVLLAEYYSPRAPHRVEAALRQAVQAANLRVCTLAHGGDPALRSMQTTLTALVLAGRQAFLAHAGDARVYLLRGGALTQLTGDHSEAAELLRLRLITPEQARYHPRRNVLTRALGSNLMMRPDFQRLPVELDDRFLLCTDGLWGEITPEALTHAASGDPELACRRLITLALDAGGGDNVSLHVVHVLDPGPPAGAPPSRIGRLLAGLRGGG